jgi:hypothetical protein
MKNGKKSAALLIFACTLMLSLSACTTEYLEIATAFLTTESEVLSGEAKTKIMARYTPAEKDSMWPIRDIDLTMNSTFIRTKDNSISTAHMDGVIDLSDISMKYEGWQDVIINNKDEKIEYIVKSPKWMTNMFSGNSEQVEYLSVDLHELLEKAEMAYGLVGTERINATFVENAMKTSTQIKNILQNLLIEILREYPSEMKITKEIEENSGNSKYILELSETQVLDLYKSFGVYLIENTEKLEDPVMEILPLVFDLYGLPKAELEGLLEEIDENIPLSDEDMEELKEVFLMSYEFALGELEKSDIQMDSKFIFWVNQENIIYESDIHIVVDSKYGSGSLQMKTSLSKINEIKEIPLPELTKRNSINLVDYFETYQKKQELKMDKLYRDMGMIGVKVNGKRVNFYNSQPQIWNGRLMVPARELTQKLGGTTTWDNSTQTATCSKDGKWVSFNALRNEVIVNGRRTDYAMMNANGRMLVPAKSIGEAFGAKVTWNPTYKFVDIQMEDPEEKPTSVIRRSVEVSRHQQTDAKTARFLRNQITRLLDETNATLPHSIDASWTTSES